MTLTVRVSASAAAAFARLPGMDKRLIKRVLRQLALDADALAMHPHGTVVEESADGLRLHVFPIGELKLVLVIDTGDLVLVDSLPWSARV